MPASNGVKKRTAQDARIVLSMHARQRLRERHDRWLLAYTDERSFNTSCYEFLDRAEFSQRHVNDTVFMMDYYEEYGYDNRFEFKMFKNALFVIVNDVCVTVLDTDLHRTTRQHGRVKNY